MHANCKHGTQHKPCQHWSNRPQPQALKQDHQQDPPPVPERTELTLCARNPGVIRNENLDDTKPARNRLADQLGLDLEAPRSQPHGLSKAAVEGAITGQQIRGAPPDQDPKSPPDQQVPQPAPPGSSRLLPAPACAHRRPCRPHRPAAALPRVERFQPDKYRRRQSEPPRQNPRARQKQPAQRTLCPALARR